MHHNVHRTKMAPRHREAYLYITCLFSMVPGGGLEPPRPCGLRILSPLRLPISPSGHVESNHLNLRMLFASSCASDSRFEAVGFCRTWSPCALWSRKH